MSLLEIAEESSNTHKVRNYRSEQLSDEDVLALLTAYIDRKVTARGMATALQKIGYSYSGGNVTGLLGVRLIGILRRGKAKLVIS